MPDAVVVGAGHNGLAAANLLADAGWDVVVLEAQASPGGAVRTEELTLPGFRHDVFSGIYPATVVSPTMRRLDLEGNGVRWLRGPLVMAHPVLDGSCAVVAPDVEETAASLDRLHPGDGAGWLRLHELWRRVGPALVETIFAPRWPPVVPAARLAARLRGTDALRFARFATLPVRRLVEEEFGGDAPGRLLAANALHADIAPESPPSGLFGWLLVSMGQAHGYPVPEGGAGAITDALVRRLVRAGGVVRCGEPVERVEIRGGRAVGVRTAGGEHVAARHAVLADVDAPSLYLRLIGREHLTDAELDDIGRFQFDSSTVKVDWALDGPIPWAAEEARRAPCVHVAEGLDELTQGAAEQARGLIPHRPYLVMGQYATVDPTRAPAGADTAWAYTHVPQRVRGDAGGDLTGRWDERETEAYADRMEARIEELAPGFRARIRARHVLSPRTIPERDANLVGGAVNAGTTQLHGQAVFRPTPSLRPAHTPVDGLYLASASAHPGGGVHGTPGAIAASSALARRRRGRRLGAGAAVLAAAAAAERRRARAGGDVSGGTPAPRAAPG